LCTQAAVIQGIQIEPLKTTDSQSARLLLRLWEHLSDVGTHSTRNGVAAPTGLRREHVEQFNQLLPR
jgi:hypothetical protein